MCPSPEQPSSNAEAATYVVESMSCGHCRAAVTKAVETIAGVDSVEVDLGAKRVDVRGSDVSDDAIRAAVDEAGYEARRAA